jgi:pyruvate dehydrogenase E2 component (dihydrolipoamide acetyltransferase)
MAKDVRLPKLGETMEEGTIVDCKVTPGNQIRIGDVLFEIETDKATLEIESPADGFVKLIMAEVGQTYRVGTPLLVLGEKDEKVSDEFLQSLKMPAKTAVARTNLPDSRVRPEPVTTPKARISPPYPDASKDVKLGHSFPATRFHKLTAQKMLRSKQEIPCFYLNVRADITELAAYRTKFNEANRVKVAYNDFIIKAVAMGLERFPVMTGQLDEDNIRLADSIGVGLAIEVPEGLVAPIVKEADKKTIIEIAQSSQSLADKAGNNQLTPDDLEGGCITVSNLGASGIDSFIPIVVPGQCSILGIGRIKDACVPDDHNINIRKVMSMTLSVDHRIANGSYAAQFLDFVKKLLEDPANFK